MTHITNWFPYWISLRTYIYIYMCCLCWLLHDSSCFAVCLLSSTSPCFYFPSSVYKRYLMSIWNYAAYFKNFPLVRFKIFSMFIKRRVASPVYPIITRFPTVMHLECDERLHAQATCCPNKFSLYFYFNESLICPLPVPSSIPTGSCLSFYFIFFLFTSSHHHYHQ
jgi:hypothetical protein